ncbi:hypothetical protein Tco_0887026 [Tanacetum coccineum]
MNDEDLPAAPNQGKKTKRRRTKESESSKKPSSTKKTTKGKTSTKGSKTSKSALAREPTPQNPKQERLNPERFKQPPRPPTLDPEWKKHQVVLDQPVQPWFNQMVSDSKDPLTFNYLMATHIDFSKYVLNGLMIKNLTQYILLGPAFNLLKDKLDWNNPEEDRYPFDLSKPLPLQGPLGHQTVAADYFFNNDLEYLKTSDPEVNKFSKQNVYSTKAILCVKKLHGYSYLEEIVVKRSDQQLYKFKEGDFVALHLNDIKDMLLLTVQHKLFHLNRNVIVDFIVALRMFTRTLILKRRVEDLQLGVESYQKKLNITKPQKTFPKIEFKEPYTPSYNLLGIVYEDLNKQKRVLRANELYKFSDGTLKSVRGEIHHRVLDFRLDYNTEMPKRKWTAIDRKRLGLMIKLINKQLSEREIIRNLERLVDARELKMDYKLMMHAPVMRTASTAVKPYQGDSSEFYLITRRQTTTGKESSNSFMAGSLPKTIHFCNSLQCDEDSFELIDMMILCTNFLNMVHDLENLKNHLFDDKECLGEEASKQGRIDDAEAEVTFIDET